MGSRSDFLPVVEAIVSQSSGSVIDVWAILIGKRLRQLLVNQVFVQSLTSRLASERKFGVLGRLIHSLAHFCSIGDTSLIICLPVLSAGLQQSEPIPVGALSCLLRLYLVVGLCQ